MATTSYGVNNALAVKLWAKKLFREALKATYMARFSGESDGSLVQIRPELSKGAGDRVTVGLRMQLTGAGVQGDGTLEGNEEALVTYSDNLFIDQLRHAVRSAGKMSEERVPFSVREEARAGLQDWWSDRIDTGAFNQLCGNTAVTDTRLTGNQVTIAPDSNHKLYVTGSADESQLSTNVLTLNFIDKCIERAKTLTPMIRPLKVDGQDKYVMFIHPYQTYDIRTSTTSGQWLDIQKAALQGGAGAKSPIYNGALGEYNGVVLQETVRVSQGVNSSTAAAISTVRRAVFCGAQSLLMGYGSSNGSGEMSWVEELNQNGLQPLAMAA